MKTLEELKSTPGLCITGELRKPDRDGNNGMLHGWVEWDGFRGTVVFGRRECGGIMEHVSISHYNRRKLPTWADMCRLKDMFFYPEEMVVQIHPAESEYVHGVGRPGKELENVLHLWRPASGNWAELDLGACSAAGGAKSPEATADTPKE